jgi:hypothetical protein
MNDNYAQIQKMITDKWLPLIQESSHW